ncbi:MAG: alanine racemase, partial [Magnetococcales bacterium]|nr:alanine racemase [Magnetococcales bacterium]
AVGDRVDLLGGDNDYAVDIEEMAHWIGTIPYEVICGLGQRLPRIYIGEELRNS